MASGGFTLYLVRHGRAAERGEEWPDDGKRPLTPQGIDRFQQVVRGLSVLGVTIDTILTSPLVRARQTADILAAGLRPHPSVEVIDVLAPGTSVADVIAALARPRKAKSIACVGHEPDLGVLAARLIGSRRALPLKKGGICRIDMAGSRTAGELAWFAPPRLLRQSAR
jgi:phosphohistidine phosphatase